MNVTPTVTGRRMAASVAARRMASDVAFPDLASPDLADAAESADLAAVSSPLCGVSPVNQAGSDGSYFRVPAQFAGVAPAYRATAEPLATVAVKVPATALRQPIMPRMAVQRCAQCQVPAASVPSAGQVMSARRRGWRWDGHPNGYNLLLRNTDTPMEHEGDSSYFNADSGASIASFLTEYLPDELSSDADVLLSLGEPAVSGGQLTLSPQSFVVFG